MRRKRILSQKRPAAGGEARERASFLFYIQRLILQIQPLSGRVKRRKSMREYTTQMDAARKGIITKEMAASDVYKRQGNGSSSKKGADGAREAERSDCRGKGNYSLQ